MGSEAEDVCRKGKEKGRGEKGEGGEKNKTVLGRKKERLGKEKGCRIGCRGGENTLTHTYTLTHTHTYIRTYWMERKRQDALLK